MKPQKRRLIFIVSAAVLVGAFLGAGVYYLADHFHSNSEVNIFAHNNVPVSTTSSLIIDNFATSTGTSSESASSTSIPVSVDMSNWQTYTNYELGISFQYPPDLGINTSNPAAVVLTFPSTYFSTAAVDADTFSVTISAACTGVPNTSLSQSMNIGGVNFTENNQQVGSGAAGNNENSIIYEGNNNDVCYTIEYNSQGPVVSATDTANIQSIVNDILSTFAFVNTPAGENEADYSAQQNQTTGITNSGLINLAGISSGTVSVGGNLVLTGSGFSGGNTVVWISNGSVQGVLWSGAQSSDTSINATIPAQVCTQVMGAGATASCPSYLILNSGVYTVSVSNQNGSTQPLYIRIQ